ncbi:type II secretion system F family protein [Effusibacillus pohliae]|uniref:type II secretion system F family protein n=1 Tax=Effusibacillus pohliae TaxID=232270 RepID=UPI0003827B73|nr:type II secretion system F family protein [Effusibacillus pohliae]
MAQFRYRAVNRAGKNLRGYIEAADQVAAAAELRKQGLFPTQLSPRAEAGLKRQINVRLLAGGRVKLQEFAPFCRQFATLIRAGVSVTQSLQVLAEQTENRLLKKALHAVEQDVRQGMSLQESFAKHENVFPEMFVHMVGAGEYAGQLETMLDRMANFFERQRVTSQKLVSALIYPSIVFLIAIAVSIFLLISVVPTFAATFAQQGVELPLPTRITLGISHFLVHQWYWALAGVIVIALAVIGAVSTQTGRLFWDTLKFRVPVFGKLYQKGVIARFARTFATLEASAVPILDQLELIRKIIGNRLFDKAVTEAQQNLRKGERLSVTLAKYPLLFPAMVTHMVAVGEETGELDGLMENLAGFYELEVVEFSSRLNALLEPLMILFLAVVVGLIILSIYLPMFTMINFAQ